MIYFAKNEYKAHVIEEMKNARVCPKLSEESLKQIYVTSNRNVKMVESHQAGLGKTEYITSTIRKQNLQVLRVPLYRETTKSGLISLINRKTHSIGSHKYALHLDVHEMVA